MSTTPQAVSRVLHGGGLYIHVWADPFRQVRIAARHSDVLTAATELLQGKGYTVTRHPRHEDQYEVSR